MQNPRQGNLCAVRTRTRGHHKYLRRVRLGSGPAGPRGGIPIKCQGIGPRLSLQALTATVPRSPQPMPHSAAILGLRLALVVTLLALPSLLRAQEEVVYARAELDALPVLAFPDRAAQLFAQSYPASLKRLGVTGTVQVQFIVNSNGKVEPASVEVLSSTAPLFAAAVKGVLERIEFRPGEVQGKKVRTLVLLPIVYR